MCYALLLEPERPINVTETLRTCVSYSNSVFKWAVFDFVHICRSDTERVWFYPPVSVIRPLGLLTHTYTAGSYTDNLDRVRLRIRDMILIEPLFHWFFFSHPITNVSECLLAPSTLFCQTPESQEWRVQFAHTFQLDCYSPSHHM